MGSAGNDGAHQLHPTLRPDHKEVACDDDSVPGMRVADDLLDRNFAAGAPNR